MPTSQMTIASEYQKPSWVLVALTSYYFIVDGILPQVISSWKSSQIEVLIHLVTIGLFVRMAQLGGFRRRPGASHAE